MNNRTQCLSFDSYLSDIPYVHRRKLIAYLDANDNWENVICLIRERHDTSKYRYNNLAVQIFAKRRSPSEEFLRDWQTQNPTIYDLFQILAEAQLHPPAEYIYKDILQLGPLDPFAGGSSQSKGIFRLLQSIIPPICAFSAVV